MAKTFEQWTVLPHGPLEKLAENLWRVEGTMPGRGHKRTMVIVRLADGRLIIHNSIALRDEQMAEITAFGTPAAILAPNAFHRQDVKIMSARFPAAKVYCPEAAKKSVGQVVPVAGNYADAPQDASVKVRHLDGLKEKEGVLEVSSADGRSLVFCDTVLFTAQASFFTKILVAPLGKLAVPNFARWFLVGDKAALRTDLERMASSDLRRVLPGHGPPVLENAPQALQAAAALLG